MKAVADRAQAMVEFALTMPLLFVLIGGALDAGRAMLASVSLTNAVRDGARAGVVAYPSPTWMEQAADRTSQNLVGIDPAALTVAVSSETGMDGTHVTVRATHAFRPLALLFFPDVFPILLSANGRALVGEMP